MAERGDSGPSRVFDWAKAHESLARFAGKLHSLDSPSPDDVRGVLQRRAKALLTPPPAASSAALVDFVIFRLGRARYAVDARQAASVVAIGKPTPLPGVPPFYLGLINHHGAIYPLLDMRPILGASAQDPIAPTHAIVALSDVNAVAIAADEIESLVRVDPETVAAFDEESRGHVSLQGTVLDSVVIVDLPHLLRDARLIVDDQATARIR
ncbi:MAG TPA: chemotaxis protein CheW [Alphaproteobacteria bacterium]|jgi:chemotaxis signal transduction protein